jgi:CRP/FNR family transcriptional regulator, cyclic AMP receptor protein
MKCKSIFDLCVDFLTDLLGSGVSTLTDDEIWKFVKQLAIHPTQAGDILFEQGGFGTTAYLLVGGSVTGWVSSPNEEFVKTFTVQAGSILGEISLLTGRPNTATLQACEDSLLLKLSRSAFITLLSLHADIPHILADLAIQRQKDDVTYFEQLQSLPELAPTNSPSEGASGLRAFCRLLLASTDRTNG